MKKLLYILALGLSHMVYAQQVAVVDLHLFDASGNPVSNFGLVVYDFSSPTGTGTFLTMTTDVNGHAVDSMAIGSAGFMFCSISLNGCLDTVRMNYTPNNGPIVYFTDTLYTCNSTGINCNFPFFANPSLTSKFDFTFWHQSIGQSTFWDFGDGNTSTLINPTHTYNSPGMYIYCVTVDSCPPVCDTILIAGTPVNCNAAFIIDSVNSQPGNVVVWNTSTPAYSQNSFTQYTWDFGDGSTSTQAFPTHTYNGAGTYVICLGINVPATATMPACSSIYCDTLKVDSLGNIIQKSTGASIKLNVIDPNTISIEESDITSSKIYPNPASDFIKIEIDANSTGELNVELIGISGAVLKSTSSTINSGLNTLELDVTEMAAGIYFVKVSKDGTNHFEKVIIR